MEEKVKSLSATFIRPKSSGLSIRSIEFSLLSFFFRAEIPCHGLEGQSGSGVADSGSLSLEVTDDGASL